MQTQNLRHIATAFICAMAFGLVASPTRAQSETTQMEDSFKKLSADEEAKLRAIIAEPTRKDGLKMQLELQINEKYNAAKKLDDSKSLLIVRKEAAELFPNSGTKNNYARSLLADGQIEAGNQWMQAAIETATNDLSRAFYWSNVAGDFYDQNKNSEALIAISTSEKLLQTANRQQESQRREIERTLEKLNRIKSLLASRKGDFGAALRAAIEAEMHARNAVKLTASNSNEIDKRNVHENLMSAIGRKLYAQNSLGKFAEVDVTLKDYLRLFQEIAYPPLTHARVLGQIAALQFDQRNFSQSEKFARRGFEIGKQLNIPETSAGMLDARYLFALIFLGQHRYPEALAEFNKLDQLAGTDEKRKARVLHSADRAATYLYNNMPSEAAPLLISAVASNTRRYGNDPTTGRPHFLTAQASGLQGVALWRIGTPESKKQAYPLLQNAVREIMAQDNADYVNIGTRRELREMIFSTYIEAASRTNPADAMAALGIADWLRGGLVQEALGDAAVRAAASNDALSNLVRQDQDARNEIKGLRNYLSGEAGATASPLPQVAVQMRERIALLEKPALRFK